MKIRNIAVALVGLIALAPFAPSVQAQTSNEYIDRLGTIAVVDDATEAAGYDRDAFGQAWADVDHNGCDTRNDILARDLDNIVYRTGSNCVIESGTLNPEPFTGENVVWTRGGDVLVDIDHIIPLKRAWDMGASQWSDELRLEFANDPMHLLAVNGNQNRSKGDRSPGEWMPPNEAFHCEYAQIYVDATIEYELTISESDHGALKTALETCPASEPTEPIEPVEPTEPVEPVEPTEPTEPVDPVDPVDPGNRNEPLPDTRMTFKNCAEASAHGYSNIKRGHWAYAEHLDRDNDGTACEDRSAPITYGERPTGMPASGV